MKCMNTRVSAKEQNNRHASTVHQNIFHDHFFQVRKETGFLKEEISVHVRTKASIFNSMMSNLQCLQDYRWSYYLI